MIAAGCGGSSGGGQVFDLGAALHDPGGGGAPVIDHAWVVIARAQIRRAAVCEGTIPIVATGPVADDLGGTAPAFSGLDAAAEQYCRLELVWTRLAGALPDGAPPELADHSMVATGDRGDGVRFVIASSRTDTTALVGLGDGFAIDVDALLVGVDGARWLTGLDLGNATVGGDQVIHVDDSHNSGLLARFDQNLSPAVALFEDRDGDGHLDATEAADDRVLAVGRP